MKIKTTPMHRAVAGVFLAAAFGSGAVHAGPSIAFGDEGSVTLGYALQVWMQARGFSSATDSGDSFDTFLRRNRITVSGQYNDLVGFYAQLEAGNDSKFEQDNRSVYYRDAYITLDYSDPLRFIVGRFKNTFSRENLEACLEPLTIDRGEVVAYTPFGGSRDTGVAMWGNLWDAKVQYRLMVSDGREGDAVAKDSPRVTARVHWSPLDAEYDYGYRGTYLGTRRVFTLGAAYDYQPDVAYADFTRRTDSQDYTGVTADFFYEQPTKSGTYTLSGAYFDYDVGDAINQDPDPSLPVTTELEASYVKAAYLLPNKVGIGRLQFYGRFENSEYNLASGFLDQTWAGLGLNYYIDGQNLKVTLEHAQVEFEVQNPANPSQQDYDQTTLALQLIF
ncbi:MAG: selenite/tellurite reduction operon porin ExtI [Thiotrichales bacterium]